MSEPPQSPPAPEPIDYASPQGATPDRRRLAYGVAIGLAAGVALVIATPGSGVGLGQRLMEHLGSRAVGLHAKAVMHVPKPVADAGITAASAIEANGLVAAGGGATIGLAKIIARQLGLPILALPTTYSGSEATAIWGTSEGERKFTGKDLGVLEQLFGNISQRKMFKDQKQGVPGSIPGSGL